MSASSTAQAAKCLLLAWLLLAPRPGAVANWATPSGAPGDTLSVVFTGDVLLDRGVREFIGHKGVDALFSPSVDSLFHASDIVVANLECPVAKIKAPVQKIYIFRGEPEWLPALRRHGITHLNLANNHSIDQGREGLADTWQQVRQAGMVPVGAAPTMAEAAVPTELATVA